MTRRPLAFLFSLLAAASAAAARVEQVPDLTFPASSVVSAAAASPLPLALFPAALAPSVPLGAPLLPAAQAQPAAAEAPAAAAALLSAAAAPAALRGTADPAAAVPSGESRALDESIRFDGARAASPAAVAPEARAAALPRPADAESMASTAVPAWIREELPVAAAKLGRALPPEYEADVLARSKVWVYKWHSRFTYEIKNGLPDGHFDPKFGIRVMLRRDWRKLKDPETHFRVLFAHEYTHWLQNEGLVTNRYGGEIPAVAVEQLRAYELVGFEGMKEGRVDFISEGNLASFDSGRKWARGDMKDESLLYFRGVLGGVAYEVGRIAGRPEAAWEFLNLVIAEKGGLKPREAFERVTGLKK